METKKFNTELKKMTAQELKEKFDAMRREYFGLRLKITTGTIKDYSQFNKLQKNIARIATHLNRIEK